jgi:hypothetical protein
MVYYRMFNKKKGEKMNEPTLKQKKQLLEELKNLFNQFEEVNTELVLEIIFLITL